MDLSLFSFVFIGDTHGFLNDFAKQKEVIESVNPDFVLAEQLQDKILDSSESVQNILNKKHISDLVDFKKVEGLIRLCAENKIKLIGLDLKDFGFNEKLKEIILGRKKPSDTEKRSIDKIVQKREKKHLSVIRKYAKISKKPLIIILGTWHLQENSTLLKALDNYVVIYPSDNKGNIVLEPPKKEMKITYKQKTKQ